MSQGNDLKKNNNNNAFDYPAVDSFSQTLCLLINFNVLAGGDSARRLASANVKTKKGPKLIFGALNISLCLMPFSKSIAQIWAHALLSRDDQKLFERGNPRIVT